MNELKIDGLACSVGGLQRSGVMIPWKGVLVQKSGDIQVGYLLEHNFGCLRS